MASKILAIKLRSLGDTVLMTAPLIELQRLFPGAQIHVLVKAEWSPLLEGLPGICKIWKFKSKQSKVSQILENSRLALALRKEKFDTVLNFHASPSSSRIAVFTGAKTRAIHFHGHNQPNHFSTVKVPGKGILKPIIERDMDTVRSLGVHIPAGLSPKVFLQPGETQRAQTFLDNINRPTPVLGLSLGASRPTKCWPIERFAHLAIEWCIQTKGSVLAMGGPTELEAVQTFLTKVDDLLSSSIPEIQKRANIRKRIFATHELPLRQLASVLSRISVLAGNDSGPKHLAIAVGTPTVTLFGPEHPFEWHPYDRKKNPYFFVESLSCRRDGDPNMPAWCGLTKCEIEDHKCMRLIGVDSVLEECKRVMDRH